MRERRARQRRKTDEDAEDVLHFFWLLLLLSREPAACRYRIEGRKSAGFISSLPLFLPRQTPDLFCYNPNT